MSDGLMERIAQRLRGMVLRSVVSLVNDAAKFQELQLTTRADEVRDRAERFQDYGFTSVPHAGAEGLVFAVGGSQAHAVVVAVGDRRYRLTGLQGGEVAVHDDLGHAVILKRAGMELRGGGHQITITDTPKVRIEGALDVTGQVKDLADTGGKTMSQMRTAYNGHTHPETGGNTLGPNPAM